MRIQTRFTFSGPSFMRRLGKPAQSSTHSDLGCILHSLEGPIHRARGQLNGCRNLISTTVHVLQAAVQHKRMDIERVVLHPPLRFITLLFVSTFLKVR